MDPGGSAVELDFHANRLVRLIDGRRQGLTHNLVAMSPDRLADQGVGRMPDESDPVGHLEPGIPAESLDSADYLPGDAFLEEGLVDGRVQGASEVRPGLDKSSLYRSSLDQDVIQTDLKAVNADSASLEDRLQLIGGQCGYPFGGLIHPRAQQRSQLAEIGLGGELDQVGLVAGRDDHFDVEFL